MADDDVVKALERVLADARAAAPEAERIATLLEGLAEAYRSGPGRTRLLRALLHLA